MTNKWLIEGLHSCVVLRAFMLLLAVLVFLLPVAGFSQMDAGPKSFSLQDDSLDQIDRRTLSRIDADSLLAEDQERGKAPQDPGPLRFAIAEDVEFDLNNSGTWQDLPDGRLWRLRIHSPGAVSHNLGISRFDIPKGAKLWIYNPSGEHVAGPFTTHDRSNKGSLWTPIIRGDEIVVELFVPTGASQPVVLITKVNKGYRSFEKGGPDKQGGCNNDVICPEGDPWRDQIRSVALYSINGTGWCSGQLMNNTSVDLTPYFLSANHCGVTSANDHTLVFYWNYESPNCGDLSGGSLAQNQTGATYRASYGPSDFVLVELDPGEILPAFNVYFTGWDATGAAPANSVCIHHPSGDEKAISFNNDPVTSTDYVSSTVDPAEDHWRVDDWEDGTTEPASSGSGLWDETSQRVVGQLHGGYASCTSITSSDWYGKLSTSWTGGVTNSTRLSNWLDPGNTGILAIDGDPHITTLDGTHYDFQGAGEFVVLRDISVGEIQVRMAPIATTFNPGPNPHHGLATCVSLNSAVAVQMGEHRITYQPNLSGIPDPSGLQLRVDGDLTTLEPEGMYLGGGRISKTSASGGIEIVFPSKYILTVTPGWWSSQSKWYLNVRIVRTPATSGVGGASTVDNTLHVGGLGGEIPPGSWLPKLPDGTSMGPMPTSLHDRYVDLYQKFGSAWRVTDATSLFDYAQGTSTDEFTFLDWPSENLPCELPDLPQVSPLDLATARMACATITDPNTKANCVFDVMVTGEEGFAETYIIAQSIANGATFSSVVDNRDPSRHTETVNFIATVIRASDREGVKPTGTVQFMLDGNNVGEHIMLDANGRAVWSTSDLNIGNHKIAVNYTPTSGSVFLASGSVQISHTVVRAEGGIMDNWLLWLMILVILIILMILVIRRFRRP